MQLREMIEAATQIAGEQKTLAEKIGVRADELTHAKAGRRGLPIEACGKLAEILGISEWSVTCASALVTEKDQKKRAYFSRFVQVERRVAAILLAAGVFLGTMTTSEKAMANNINFVSTPEIAVDNQKLTNAEDMYYRLCAIQEYRILSRILYNRSVTNRTFLSLKRILTSPCFQESFRPLAASHKKRHVKMVFALALRPRT